RLDGGRGAAHPGQHPRRCPRPRPPLGGRPRPGGGRRRRTDLRTEETVRFERELEAARGAAERAAALLLERAGAERVREKGRADLVTAVDEAAERAIVAHLGAAFPDDAVVAEEFAAATRATGRRWIVDPLDGTVNYVHGHPFACVSIALVDGEGPAVGVV